MVCCAAALFAGVVGMAATLPSTATAGFRVSPASVDVRREGGETSLGVINVRVTGERQRQFRVDVEPVEQTGAVGYDDDAAARSPFSASRWIAIRPQTFPGGEKRTQPIEYAIRIPRGAEPGDHVAAIVVKRAGANGEPLSVVEALAVRVTVRVAGKVHQAVEIDEISTPKLASGGPIEIMTTVRNSGNVRLDFSRANRAALQVLEGSEVVASRPLEGTLYPGQVRSFQLDWQDPSTLAHPKARVSVELGDRTARRESSFWVVPWRQGGALVLVTLAALVLFVQYRRRNAPAVGS